MRDRQPFFSVSIITYNQAQFLAQAIESALMQETSFDFEIRIGDDCSTDGTRDVILDFQRRFPNRIFPNFMPRKGLGVPGRENNVANLSACRGRYIAMLDGDDYWCSKDKLQRQVDILESRPELSACAHDSWRLDEARGVMLEESLTASRGVEVPESCDIGIRDILSPQLFQTSSFCFRRRCLPVFPDWFMSVPLADVALYHLVAQHGPIRYEGQRMSVYRLHDDAVYSAKPMATKSQANRVTEETLFANVPAMRSRVNLARIAVHRSRSAIEHRMLGRTAGYVALLMLLSPRRAARISRAAWRRFRPSRDANPG